MTRPFWRGFVECGAAAYNMYMAIRTLLACAVAAVCLTGCAHSSVSLNSTNSPAAPGSHVAAGASGNGASVRADISPATYLGISMFALVVSNAQSSYRRWSSGPGMTGPDLRSPPPMAPDRVVTEQDCSQPAVFNGANLRCK